jgi:crotonobetainyl-CoA:carnitine CoA-transferase CaiB-like acyl-CoA transferase
VLVDEAVGAWFAQHDRDEALRIMRESGATVGPVYSAADAANDVHFRLRGVVVDVEDKGLGSVPMHNIVPRMSDTPGVWRRPAPAVGEHTQEILDEFGIAS